MKSTKGLSTVVATLIIILLTLVAIGIIWVVIRSIVSSGSQQVDINSKCLAVNIEAVSVTNSTPTTYAVTLKRNSGGTDDLSGIKVTILTPAGANTGVLEFGNALKQLQTATNASMPGPAAAHSVEFTPWFTDASGNAQICSNTQTFNF